QATSPTRRDDFLAALGAEPRHEQKSTPVNLQNSVPQTEGGREFRACGKMQRDTRRRTVEGCSRAASAESPPARCGALPYRETRTESCARKLLASGGVAPGAGGMLRPVRLGWRTPAVLGPR